MSISALHMKTTQGLTGEQIDLDIQRHRGETVQQLTAALYSDSNHGQTLEAAGRKVVPDDKPLALAIAGETLRRLPELDSLIDSPGRGASGRTSC